MSDNWISTITGSFTSILAMITGMIKVETMIEVAVYGLIGGAVGMIGKWLVQIVKFKLEKRFKKQ